VTDGSCATGLQQLAQVQRASQDGETQTQALTVGRSVLQQCPDESKLFVVAAQIQATAVEVFGNETVETTTDWNVSSFSINHNVLVCTPGYKVQKALVTTNSQGALSDVELRPELRNLTISQGDLASAVNISLVAASPAILVGPMAHDLRIGGSSYDEFFGVMISTWTRSPIEYLDPAILSNDTQRLFKAVGNQIAARHFTRDTASTTAGSYRATQSRIVLLNLSLRVVEAGIVTVIVCALLMIAYLPWVPRARAGDGTAILAAVLARSGRLKISLKGSGIKSDKHMTQSLADQTFACMDQISVDDDLLQAYSSSNSAKIVISADGCCFWRPLPLTKPMKAIILVIPLAIIASLELTCYMSHKSHNIGLAAVPSNHKWHYAWTRTPALVMTITKLLCQSVTSAISLLDPYSRLRKQTSTSDRTLGGSHLSKTALQLCYESLRSRRWALLATALSALVGPFLTIVVSGLFFIQAGSLSLDATFSSLDYITSPSEKSCSSNSWTQASLCAASLLDSGYDIYPRGTHKNLVYPLQSEVRYTSPAGARMFNLSSVQVSVPVVWANTTCRAMDPNGFRYTLETNGTNNQGGFDVDGIYGGNLNDTHLNLTHTDLAGYRCNDLWYHHGSLGGPDNGTRCTDQLPSLGFDFPPRNLTPFLNLSYADQLSPELPLRWAHPTSWPDSQALAQAVATRNGRFPLPNPDLFAIYGTWTPGHLNLTGIVCYYDVRLGRANVTYHSNTTEVVEMQADVGTFSDLSNTSGCTPWSDTSISQLESFLPNNSLWNTALNGSNLTTLYSFDGATTMAERISRIYNNYFTQYYNVALRDYNATNETNQTAGFARDDNWQRLVQDKTITRILQALLAVMWLCTAIALFLFDARDLLPKNPCSIAAQASLLADSQFLDKIPPGAENATAEELMQMTPFVDHEFSMGWWDDGNDGRRFGIDVGRADYDRDGDTVDEEEEADSAWIG